LGWAHPPGLGLVTANNRHDDATALIARLGAGELTPVEAIENAITECERTNPSLNALIHPRFDAALDQARRPVEGPLAGVPIAVKDLGCEQAGEPHHRGAAFLAEIDWRGDHDSYLYRSLTEAGAVSIGRTNTPEFGTTITTEPAAYGPTRNPSNLGFSPGGSSGGSAALVAAGVVPLAHGNDGGGSIRVPASACGLVGLKVTRGRVSTGPRSGEHRGGFAVDGMLTRTVRDSALALDVITRRWPGESIPTGGMQPWSELLGADIARLRIGVTKGRCHPDCGDAVDAAARALETLGHDVVPDHAPEAWFDPEVTDQTIVMRTVGMARELESWEARIGRPLTEDDVEQSNWWSAEIGKTLSGTMYVAAQTWLRAWARRVASFWSACDLLLTPVLGAPPPPIGHLSDPVEGPGRLRELIGFVDQANVSGQPAISVPMGLSAEGLPIGVQLVAASAREDLLLAVAHQLEAADAFAPLSDLDLAS